MDPAILSAASALAGSLIGGASMLAASWLSQREQFRAQALVHEAVKRETLYAEFIIEASKRLTEAWTSHAESPEVVAGLYSAVERMRLTSDREDMVNVRFVELAPPRRIVEAVSFVTSNPASFGEMTMIATFEEVSGGTLVFEHLPPGLRAEDNEAGSRLSLEQLARRFE